MCVCSPQEKYVWLALFAHYLAVVVSSIEKNHNWLYLNVTVFDFMCSSFECLDTVGPFGIGEGLKAMTHTTRNRGVFDVANLPRYRTGFTPMLFQWSHSYMQHFLLQICCNLFTLQFFNSRPPFIAQFFVQFCVATGLTAVCFTICMIQHVFSILIYSFNHIFIKLPWIEDKQQQHCFCIEGKSIIGIGYTYKSKSSAVWWISHSL